MTDGEAVGGPLPMDRSTAAERPSPVELLYAEINHELRRFVLGVVRDPDVTDDVMQATFVKAVEHAREVRSETARGWLFRVAFHESLASRRRQSAQNKGLRYLAGIGPKDHDSPGEALLRSETVEAVRKAFGELPEEQKRVVLARIYEDKKFAQIAQEFGWPLGTVLTRMRRALDRMRRSLRTEE